MLLDRIQDASLDNGRRIEDRVAAIELLKYEPFDRAAGVYSELLSTGQPIAVQLAAIESMRTGADKRTAAILLEHWPTLGPTARGPALSLMLQRSATMQETLRAMADGKMVASVVSLDQRARLLKHSNDNIRALATKVFGGAISANRRQVAKRYRPALELEGSVAAGAEVFKRTCATCHVKDGVGHEVGPDISDVRNRSREALLYDILDPNQGVNANYTAYTVVVTDGRVLTGLMATESAGAIVLKEAEGKEQVIPRADIEEIRASGKSLMPEGVEKDVSVPQMADLLEYLKADQRNIASQ